MNGGALLVAGLLLTGSLVSRAEEGVVRLQEIDGRPWLVDAGGRPFFAHGVTHVGARHGVDVEKVGRACRELGFNAYGYGCPEALKGDLPYLEGRNIVPMSTYRQSDGSFRFLDIFDSEVQAGLVEQVRKMCLANRGNSNLIGYCWTDLGAWPLENPTGKNWVEFIRALPEESPGGKAYRKFREFRVGAEGDALDRTFLRIIAREYFGVLGKANRRFDPDHLIFGDRFTLQTAVPEVIEEMLPHVDAIAIQPNFRPGFPHKQFDRVHQMTKKPILLCDFAIRFSEEGKEIRGWRPEESPALAGLRYSEYIRDAFATPYVIGAFWCNPVNSKPGFSKAGIKQGLFGEGLKPRPELNRAIRELNRFLAEGTPEPDPVAKPD